MSIAVLLAAPVPPSVEPMGLVVLLYVVALPGVTFTEIEHEPPATIMPLFRLMLPVPAVAVTVPLQALVTSGVLETRSPEGRLSVNATPLNPLAEFGLVIIKITLESFPSGTVAGANDLPIDGGAVVVTVAAEGPELTGAPVGGVPLAVAESLTDPLFKSACVMV